jgi:hypothetical protein
MTDSKQFYVPLLTSLLVGKPDRKRPLTRRRWVSNSMIDLAEIGSGDMEGSCECGNEPSSSIKLWDVIVWLRN